MADPVTIAPKKDSSCHFFIDYKKLSAERLIPLPLIFDQLGDSKIFSHIGLQKRLLADLGRIPHPKEETAFTCHRGLFEFRARILVQVTIYRRLLIGRDGHLDQSEAYDIS